MDRQPNVLLIVLNACRADHIAEYAPPLSQLRAAGVQFTNVVAPAKLVTLVRGAVDDLPKLSNETVTEDVESRLSDLGYR